MSTPLPPQKTVAVSEPSVPATTPPKRWIRTPPIDIYESDDGLVLLADLPGVSANDLEVQVQDNKLTLSVAAESLRGLVVHQGPTPISSRSS
jgi:HSP20 family molecular chaperone IbpA